MTPNRLVSSPVMFGSLPTGVWPGGSVPQTASAYNKAPLFLGASFNDSPRPWQTLLFRPYPISKNTQGASAQMSQQATHPGQYNPMDHYLLDLFFMPVVEPYAISEPLAEAGKINMNYQILPFTNIKRATGMNAVLKGEFITAIPNSDAVNAKKTKGFDDASWDKFYDESDPTAKKFWHRPVDVKNTLLQFDERFNFKDIGVTGNSRGLFRSASQICETYLIPNVAKGFSSGEPGKGAEQSVDFSNLTASTRPDRMVSFWNDHATTGDNVKEKPYSNIYSRVTTRSNTFRVHVRSQVIKKARSSNPSKFESNKDVILSEYRGSTVLERFIDPNDVSKPLPEYAKDPSVTNPLGLAPLDSFYQFREIETKRFNP